jgi:hypothetical protein
MEWIVERFISLIPILASAGKDKRELADAALRALSIALDETSIYINSRNRGNKDNHDIEYQLARYWSAAAIVVRHFDADLAEICTEKNRFWLDPDGWEGNSKQKERISLDNVRAQYSELLKKGAKSK